MATEKYYGTGRRKSSVARVYVMPGNGNITINKRDIDEYFGLETLKVIVRQPLETIGATDKFDIKVSVHGGGYTGQAGAIRHGIARALVQADAENRPALKKAGFLTRDSRMKEIRSQSSQKSTTVFKEIICAIRTKAEKPDFTRVIRVVGSCKKYWILNGMQQVSNT